MKTIEDFKKAIAESELKDELAKHCDKRKPESPKERTDILLGFARDKGYDISVEDLALFEADMQPLDEQALNKANGGLTGAIQGRETCDFDYVCMLTWNTCTVSDQCMGDEKCDDNILCYSDEGHLG